MLLALRNCITKRDDCILQIIEMYVSRNQNYHSQNVTTPNKQKEGGLNNLHHTSM